MTVHPKRQQCFPSVILRRSASVGLFAALYASASLAAPVTYMYESPSYNFSRFFGTDLQNYPLGTSLYAAITVDSNQVIDNTVLSISNPSPFSAWSIRSGPIVLDQNNSRFNQNGYLRFGTAGAISNAYDFGVTSSSGLNGVRISTTGLFTVNPLTYDPVRNGHFDSGYSGPLLGTWKVAAPGDTPLNPLVPSVGGGGIVGGTAPGFEFQLDPRNVTCAERGSSGARCYYDPASATGYNFEGKNSATKFTSVIVPKTYGVGLYDLFIPDQSGQRLVDSGVVIGTNEEFNFKTLGFSSGLDKFSLRGIDPSAGIDPSNPLGFVVGLTFADTGGTPVDFTMTPLLSGSTAVPIPAAAYLFASGLVGLNLARRKHDRG